MNNKKRKGGDRRAHFLALAKSKGLPAFCGEAVALLRPRRSNFTSEIVNKLAEIKKADITSIDNDSIATILFSYYYLLENEKPREANCPKPDFDQELEQLEDISHALRKKKAINDKDWVTIMEIIDKARWENPQKMVWRIVGRMSKRPRGRPKEYALDYLLAALVLFFKKNAQEFRPEMLVSDPDEMIRLAEEGKARIPWRSIEDIIVIIVPEKETLTWVALKKRYSDLKKARSIQTTRLRIGSST
jgi:hypothetical protein